MTPERWKRIEGLYHSALARDKGERAPYLAKACAGDEELHREVESLLANEGQAGSFLDGCALEAAARGYASSVLPDLSGKRLGRYEVIVRLGVGGMGEVYRARDTRLKREVALKVLPAERMAEQGRRRRFEHEARAASALNHPNIITIHDIDRAEGIDFIAMEYVPGKTLAEAIGRRGLPLRKAVEYATQVASALATAHEAGIVHRDLKPANIMINDTGQVKVLDFGLAKLAERAEGEEAGSTETAPLETETGTILGTVAYMSPEQAEGKKVDARSDIFSFGAVLYEMVTGRRAFQRDSTASTLAAILKEEPKPLGELGRGLPPELEKILTRCLRKDPERRFQHMSDLKVELEELKQESDSGPLEATPVPTPRRRWIWALAVLAILIVGAGGTWFLLSHRRTGMPDAELKIVPLTSYLGIESYPAISPDGKMVAFCWTGEKERRGPFPSSIYVQQVGSETAVRRTDSPTHDFSPAWSPDSRRIAFCRLVGEETEKNNGFAIHVMDALGGPEFEVGRSLAGYVSPWRDFRRLAWSPDNKFLAVADEPPGETSSSIYLLSMQTRERRRLTTPPASFDGDFGPAFCPDGRTLAFIRLRHLYARDVYRLSLTSDGAPAGNPQRLTPKRLIIQGLNWTPDGRGIVFAAGGDLWRIPVSGGEPERLNVGDRVAAPSVSREGDRLVYVTRDMDANLWRVRGPNAARAESLGKSSSAERLFSSTAFDTCPKYSPDGKQILFISLRGGALRIWRCDSDGSNCLALTSIPGGYPRWSPDGRFVVFLSRAEEDPGNTDIFVVSAEGGEPRRVTSHDAQELYASWSRDGKWIYFGSKRSGDWQIWKIPSEGGEAVRVTRNGGIDGYESADGRFLYYAKGWPTRGIWRIPVQGGEETQVLDDGGELYWELLEDGICFAEETIVRFLRFSTGRIETVWEFPKEQPINGFTVSPDGQWVLCALVEQAESDIMLVENFK